MFCMAVAIALLVTAFVESVVSKVETRLTGPAGPVAPVAPVSPFGPFISLRYRNTSSSPEPK